MQHTDNHSSLEALQDIRNIMDKSTRFVSLSGMSGVWAGCTGIAGTIIANSMLGTTNDATGDGYVSLKTRLLLLAITVFVVAVSGAYFFTYKKAKKYNQAIWSNAGRQMVLSGFFPLLVGGIFCIAFILHRTTMFIGPACLMFYGLALISGGRHTLSEIKYLGMLNIALGCFSLLFPGYSLYFWAAGFGALNIIYGLLMWNKYDK